MSNTASIVVRGGVPLFIAVSGNTYRLLYDTTVNIVDYGGSTDATADINTAALLAAVAAVNAAGGGRVLIPEGRYQWVVPTQGITAGTFMVSNYSNVTIEGAGQYLTTLVDSQGETAGESTGNPTGQNAFLTFSDCTNIHVTKLGFEGSGVWQQSNVGKNVSSRKAVYFRSSAVGCRHCSVTECYFTLIEGEALYADGNDAHPTLDCHFDRNRFYRCLSNQTNIASGSRAGSINVTCNDNIMDSPGGSAYQGGGQDLQFCRNVISMEAGIFLGADTVLVACHRGLKIEDNFFSSLNFVAGVSVVHVGFVGDVGNTDVSVRRNRFRDILLLNVNDAGVIRVDSTFAACNGIVVGHNDIMDCGDANHGAFPGSVGIKLLGANTFGATIEPNNIDNGAVAFGIATGIHIKAGVPGGNTIRVMQQNFAANVTTPFTFDVAPLCLDTSGSVAWDPPNVAAGAQTTTTVTVPGCQLGDVVSVGFSLSLQGMQLTGYVSAAGTVTVVLRNGTAGALDLANGTLRARCTKS